jgi:hypothetical protein
VVTRKPSQLPEVYCDLNARMTERGYSLERNGSVSDLKKLGLSLQEAVGRRFTFFMDDADEQGRPDDIMFDGLVVSHPQYGILAEEDGAGIYWRSQVARADA